MQRDINGTARRAAQTVEIVVAVLAGVATFVFLVVPAAVLSAAMGLHGAGWDRVGRLGLVIAILAASTCTIGVLARPRQRGL